MKKSDALRSLFALSVLLAAGCATTTDMASLKNDVSNLQIESINQKREINQIKTSLPGIASDLSALKEQGFTAMRESQASLLTQTSDLSKEVQMLKGRFDENKYFLDKTMKDFLTEKEVQQAKMSSLENEMKDLKTKLASLAADVNKIAGAVERIEAAKSPEPPKQPEASAETKAAENNPQNLYDDAQIDFKEKRYPESRAKFEKFIKDYPNHSLAPNSYFWIGETYYAEKKYEDAILAYESLLKKYPQHDKAKGSMLKQGFAFIEMGDKKTGKVILERLIEKHPQSTEAEFAEDKIAEILSKNNAATKSKKKKR